MTPEEAIEKNKVFVLNIRKFCEQSKIATDTVVKKVLFDLSARIVQRSPVDTGRFRANWQYSVGTPPSGELEDTDQDGSSTTARLWGDMADAKGGAIHYIGNNLPYAATIEYGLYPDPPKHGTGKTAGGFSTQAPQGVVRVTVEEFATVFRDAVNGTRDEMR